MLKELKFKDTFNPYSDRCDIHDKHDAPRRRSNALQRILEIATKHEIDSLWIGRDLGYRGGRRTGLALTDDMHIHLHAKRWGVSIERTTKGESIAERSATIIWSVLSQIEARIFLWNVFPLHPHESENPFSNRSHNSQERKKGEELLVELIRLLKPRRLVAIGNDATQTAHSLSVRQEVIQIRHPSYGGQTQFLAQMCNLYDLPSILLNRRN